MTARDRAIERLLSGLDPEQREAVTAEPGPVCVLAGAGTGKTRAVTHRIAWRVLRGDMRGQHVTAVTFTARAAGEMRDRLRGLGVAGVNARTFHSAALRQLRYFGTRRFGGQLPELVDSTLKFTAIAAARAGLQTSRAKNYDLTTEIEWAASSLIGPDDYVGTIAALGRDAPAAPEDVAKVYAAYIEAKRRAGVMDFADVLAYTADLIGDVEAAADQIRSQYRFFVVDEYQDVTPLQQRLLDAWLGDRDDITVVGDASQTIYSFTGATSRNLLDFTRRHQGAALVRLVRDYRSTPQVVGLANQIIGESKGREAKMRLELVGQRPDGPAVTAEVFADEAEEADMIARRCSQLIADGASASEIAVLYRTNAQSQAYEEALASYGVPTVVTGAARFFERAEVRQAVVALRSAAKTEIGAMPLAEAVPTALEAVGWRPDAAPAGGAQREAYEAVTALANLAEQFLEHHRANPDEEGPEPDLDAFCAELSRRASEQHAPAVEGVTLASLHAAKGLEWDAVFLVGLADGTLPTTFARTETALEEERRLLYVGITRARERLQLSYGLARNSGGRERRLCRFLAPLGLGGFPRTPEPSAAASKQRGPKKAKVLDCSGCGKPLTDARDRKLGHCSDCPATMDEALFERLREWRVTVAKADGKPAFTVFTDVTLIAIAERCPASDSELAALHGIGKSKLDKYGPAVLHLVNGGAVEDAVALSTEDS
ncbi:ATP-dependent DNA helicase UvrD2 [Glycomyces paridis]|uniref:DNA 3'-5' helicase n=1 Tax=Glycomyces paridis TaxID=2126555 RepID=A0A4V4HN29_9ACTN|nr:ATP-dependent DNA helicase UvrD2 [Glycomyces paridis]THV24466.1 ATP-dependent DNA helicase UvrD2 [Glycomyces paridis]